MVIYSIILSSSGTNSNLPEPLCDFDIHWATSENGYVDSEFIKMYANQLCHDDELDRPLLMLLDGHATRNPYDVIELCLHLNIRLFFILPHTSHGFTYDHFFYMNIE